MKLSILIHASKEQKQHLDRLLSLVMPQTKPFEGEIEVFIEADSSMQIGAKCNSLLKDAVGKYIWFLNPTDVISDTAVSDIFKAIESGPDSITISGSTAINGKAEDWTVSNSWKNPMKRSIAIRESFRKRSVKAIQIWEKRLNNISPFFHVALIEKPIVRNNVELTVVK